MKAHKTIIASVRRHKVMATASLAVIAFVGYKAIASFSAPTAETRYVLAAAERGTVVKSVTGTGQVSALNQIDVKPRASGEYLIVAAVAGKEVRAGDVLARIDSSDAAKAVRDAETSLETAKLNYEKIVQPADNLSLLQARHALDNTKESRSAADTTLSKAYTDAFAATADTYLDMPAAMSGLNDVLHSNSLSGGSQWNVDYYATAVHAADDSVGSRLRNETDGAYQAARTSYDAANAAYAGVSRLAAPETVEELTARTYDTAIAVSDALKSAVGLVQRFKDSQTQQNLKVPAITDTHLSTLISLSGTVNGHISALLAAQNAIQSGKDAIVDADRSIAERSASLDKLLAGADPLDVRSQRLAVEQRRNTLADAQSALADYIVRAPFSGIIATVNVKKGDEASPGTAVATLITKEQVAEISLNEVDVAAVAVGEKATMTFDAVPGLAVAGEVASVDSVGAVSQGVVTYSVQVRFATQDDRVKSGMSVSAAIVTGTANDVITVPSGAVKTSGSQSYVEVVVGPAPAGATSTQGAVLAVPPVRRPVEVGLSSDTKVAVTSGLEEGELVVIRTVNSSQTAQKPVAPSIFGGGGNVRVIR